MKSSATGVFLHNGHKISIEMRTQSASRGLSYELMIDGKYFDAGHINPSFMKSEPQYIEQAVNVEMYHGGTKNGWPRTCCYWPLYEWGSTLRIDLQVLPGADVDSDGRVDLEDFAFVGSQWQGPGGVPSADIQPPGGDGIVNMDDFLVLCAHWLEDWNPP